MGNLEEKDHLIKPKRHINFFYSHNGHNFAKRLIYMALETVFL